MCVCAGPIYFGSPQIKLIKFVTETSPRHEISVVFQEANELQNHLKRIPPALCGFQVAGVRGNACCQTIIPCKRAETLNIKAFLSYRFVSFSFR